MNGTEDMDVHEGLEGWHWQLLAWLPALSSSATDRLIFSFQIFPSQPKRMVDSFIPHFLSFPLSLGSDFLLFFFLLFFFCDKHFICKFLVVIKRIPQIEVREKIKFQYGCHTCTKSPCVCCACYCHCHFCRFRFLFLRCYCRMSFTNAHQNTCLVERISIESVSAATAINNNLPSSPSHIRREYLFILGEKKKGEKIPRHFNIKTQNFDVMHNQSILRLRDSLYPE